jgi:NAD(P)-dependent dehydrogenase (short-subunit alcohol dehydrogenase family)
VSDAAGSARDPAAGAGSRDAAGEAGAGPAGAPMRPLDGRAALVTGAAQGIGAAIAERLAADGARVALNDRVASARLAQVAARAGGVAAPADMGDAAAVAAMVAGVEARVGPLDVLVVNHAAFTKLALLRHAPQDWWRDVTVNLSGAWYALHAALPAMRARRRGRIVLISSCWAITGEPAASAYCAAKAGLISLTRSLAPALAPEGIAVNAVAPGYVATPQAEVDAAAAGVPLDELLAEAAAATPIGRIGAPEDVAATVAFLASDRASSFVGQTLQPNGGLVTGPA